jgi:glyoxylase-like metal-dependent hydrolase (beta-lactamase superfamily II)
MLRAWVALVVCGFVLVAYAQAPTPDAAAILKAASTAMGADSLKTVQFSGNGWDGCLGQAWNVTDGKWARWELKDYSRTIDYDAGSSRHTAQQRAAMDPKAVGGCGAVPGAAPRAQQSNITSTSPWAQQLQIVLTPYGFIRFARDNNPTAEVLTVNGRRLNVVTFSTTRGNETYRVRGYFAPDNTVEKVETWLDDPIFGDMLVEAEFSNYRSFEGLRFPARIYHKQGGLGILELNIDKVAANPPADAAAAPAAGGRGAGGPGGGGGGARGAGAAPAAAATPGPVEMAPGVFVLDGAYQAVAVAFNDYSVVIDGMQNEARTRAVIAQTKQAIPGKPIRYVVVTHSHFDHVSGLRDFVAEGATILTHESSVKFFQGALSTPRTINKAEAKPAGTPKITAVGEKYVLQDAKQTVELYRIQGHVHADDMLIAYIPSAKTIVESDLVQPWISPQFTNVGYLSHLAKELDRLKLNYESFVSIHRPTPPPTVSRADFLKAAGN